ncbi:MAG: response regulator [Thermodesulfobacteriota bacterium]
MNPLQRGNTPHIEAYDEQGILSHEASLQLFRQALSAMRLVDRDFTVVLQNPAMEQLTRYPTAQAVGSKCYEVARSRQFCHTELCPNTQILAGHSRVEQTYDCELWDGTVFPAWVRATPWYNREGRIVGSLQILRDDTDLAAFTQALENKNRELAAHLNRIQGYNEIILALSRQTRVEELADATLALMPQFTPAVMGVVYLYHDRDDRLIPVATRAVSGLAPSFLLGEGLPGEVALREQPVFMTNIPSSYFQIHSGTGVGPPTSIACLPIQTGDRFVGVLELAGLRPFAEHQGFLEDVTRQLGIAMHNALMRRKTEDQAVELAAQNERLESQNEELRAQSEELIAQSEEIQSQAEELTAQRDALEKKTLEADEANRMKSVFLSNMSHELRTPLNAILGLTRLMMDGMAGAVGSQQAQYLEIILRNGNSLLELINDILDLSRIETGREEVRFAPVNLPEFLEAMAGNIRALAERQGLAFVLRVGADVTSMVSDERKLGQILTNLMGNAIKFTEQGTVTLEVRLADREGCAEIQFVVEDTGIGIAPEHLAIIFEPFRQIDGSASRKYSGSGLGLSICKRLTTLLGGELAVQSTLGQGSRFTLALPRDRRGKNRLSDPEWQARLRSMLHPDSRLVYPQVTFPAPAPGESAGVAESAGEPSLGHILLVDDDMIAIRELGAQLREASYRVSFALDGSTGLRLLEQHHPDLVLLDLVMPVMDGHAFLREVRQLPAVARTPVVILSALDLDPEAVRHLPDNVRGVLAKGSIRREDLLDKVRLALSQPAPASSPRPRPPGEGRPRPHGRQILIAEDNPDNLFLLEEILRANGYEIRRAANGQEAVAMAVRQAPDLVLMDIQMPDMDGLEAVQAFRNHPALADIPIIALTARAMKGDREEFLASGCDDYLAKPVATDILLAAIHRWLGPQRPDGAEPPVG